MRPAALLCACGMAVALGGAAAAAEPRYNFDIPAEPLSQALRAFGTAANQQIIFAPALVENRRSSTVRGRLSAEDGLARLLENTGLSGLRTPSGVIQVREAPPSSAAPPGPPAESSASIRKEPPPEKLLAATVTPDLLGELVITATRQPDTVSRVALSITAATQLTLDQEGVKTIQDLSRTVPSVTFRRDDRAGNTNIFIRGITSASSNTAPTTGVYLDDTPLQKRNLSGLQAVNGTPFPEIFDLERVEVLRGPQGTLYGGSAEGGAVRFITPTPSLTRYSAYARTEVSSTEGGDPSYEGGVALGGPIVQDKVGFRASVWARHTGGYIDHVNIYTGQTMENNTNSGDAKAARLVLLLAPTDQLKITPSLYASYNRSADGDLFWQNVPQYKANSFTFNNSGAVNGVPYAFPNTTYAGGVYGPYNAFGPGKSGVNVYTDTTGGGYAQKSPRSTRLFVPSLTIEYDLPGMTMKSITSYVEDHGDILSTGQNGLRTAILPTANGTGNCGQGSATLNYMGGCSPLTINGYPYNYGDYAAHNNRYGLTQELRFSSDSSATRFTWVGGVFYSSDLLDVTQLESSNENAISIGLRGAPEAYFLGAPPLPGGLIIDRHITVHESELAAFGEANFMITDKLKITAGLRVSHDHLTFSQIYGGAIAGAPPGYVGTSSGGTVTDPGATNAFPTDLAGCPSSAQCPLQYTTGSQKETPVTPKIGLSYQLTDHDMIYATIAKGFRPGGVNPPVPPIQCAADLASLGASATPRTYNSDSVWSYEAGAKVRVGGVQLNSSVFYIDWKNPQVNTSLTRCNFAYTVNAGAAVSKGFDVQVQTRLFSRLTLSGSAAYTDARFTGTVKSGAAVIINKGDQLGAPTWQLNIGAQYDFVAFNRGAYLRADDQYSGAYQRTIGPGALGYDPITAMGAPTNFVTARLGIKIHAWDLNVFGANLTNSQNLLNVEHASGFPLVTASTFRPREVGLQATYRY